MAYIEDNLKVRSRPKEDDDEDKGPADPQEALYRIVDKFKVNKETKTKGEEGSVTNSLTMLTAIPEVDLGMERVHYPLVPKAIQLTLFFFPVTD